MFTFRADEDPEVLIRVWNLEIKSSPAGGGAQILTWCYAAGTTTRPIRWALVLDHRGSSPGPPPLGLSREEEDLQPEGDQSSD